MWHPVYQSEPRMTTRIGLVTRTGGLFAGLPRKLPKRRENADPIDEFDCEALHPVRVPTTSRPGTVRVEVISSCANNLPFAIPSDGRSRSRAGSNRGRPPTPASRDRSISRARPTDRRPNHWAPACTLRRHWTSICGAISSSTTPRTSRRRALSVFPSVSNTSRGGPLRTVSRGSGQSHIAPLPTPTHANAHGTQGWARHDRHRARGEKHRPSIPGPIGSVENANPSRTGQFITEATKLLHEPGRG